MTHSPIVHLCLKLKLALQLLQPYVFNLWMTLISGHANYTFHKTHCHHIKRLNSGKNSYL